MAQKYKHTRYRCTRKETVGRFKKDNSFNKRGIQATQKEANQ